MRAAARWRSRGVKIELLVSTRYGLPSVPPLLEQLGCAGDGRVLVHEHAIHVGEPASDARCGRPCAYSGREGRGLEAVVSASRRSRPRSRRRAGSRGPAAPPRRRWSRCPRRSRAPSRPVHWMPGRCAAALPRASGRIARALAARWGARSCATRRRWRQLARASAFSGVTSPGAMYGSRSTADRVEVVRLEDP